jgi:hypothetical protein
VREACYLAWLHLVQLTKDSLPRVFKLIITPFIEAVIKNKRSTTDEADNKIELYLLQHLGTVKTLTLGYLATNTGQLLGDDPSKDTKQALSRGEGPVGSSVILPPLPLTMVVSNLPFFISVVSAAIRGEPAVQNACIQLWHRMTYSTFMFATESQAGVVLHS